MSSYEVSTGEIFGMMKVLGEQLPTRNSRRWYCECVVCGKKYLKTTCHLTGVKSSRTKCACARAPLTGYTISNIKVGKIFSRGLQGIRYECICFCGKSFIAVGSRLTNRRVQSCGCLLRSKNDKGESGFNLLYGNYKRMSVVRELQFDLTKEVFRELTSGDCVYCGAKPSLSSKLEAAKGTTESGSTYSEYIYNGVDRIDNECGYAVGNCASCCFDCNRAKATSSFMEFNAWIQRLVLFHEQKSC